MPLGCGFSSGAAAGGFLSGSATRCLFTRVTSKIDLCCVRFSPCDRDCCTEFVQEGPPCQQHYHSSQ
eukprot:scaffold209015_cov43-Attheya_sp.AAC.1